MKRKIDACLAGSQKLTDSKITNLTEAKKFCEEEIKKINNWLFNLIKILKSSWIKLKFKENYFNY